VRQEQNLATQWRQLDAELTQELSVSAKNRNPQAKAQAQRSLDDLNEQITALDQKITAAFPRYTTLVDPPPASLADVQTWLHPDEVLAEFVTFGGSQGNGTYLFLVSSSSSKWSYIKAGANELAQSVMTLRCGLDSDAWNGDGAKICQPLVGANDGELPPFNHQAAKDLFDTLFGDVRAEIANKSVILVLPEPLSSLPFQALITGPFDTSQRKTIPWFGRTNPISVVPSVASLGALRQLKVTRAPEPYIGFGDPLLAGNSTCAPDLATFSNCPTPKNLNTIAAGHPGTMIESLARNAAMPSMQKVFQGGKIDLAQLHAQCPLPETEFQLRCTATSLNAPQSTVHIQAEATVTAVEKAPLNRYRVIVFATHGLLSSDTQSFGGDFEPALLLTPPNQPIGDDQGLLTASIISHLNLNADWVLLTACNTGEPGSGGEAMSGLASAFLYSGARTVLASHWAVLETATVLLASDAFIQIGENPSISRAEAMRRAMIVLMDNDNIVMSHPTAWAPFTIIGESGPL
jgi:CHAT domain-containing protein